MRHKQRQMEHELVQQMFQYIREPSPVKFENVVQAIRASEAALLDTVDVDGMGCNAVTGCVHAGRPDMLKILLKAGASPAPPTGNECSPLCTALSAATYSKMPQLFELLCDYGADINADTCEPPLCTAVRNREQHELVRTLIRLGASLDATDSAGRTPLTLACEHGVLEYAILLLKAGADPEWPDESGDTPLKKAVVQGHADLTSLLLQFTHDFYSLNTVDCFITACILNKADVVGAAIRAGVPVDHHEKHVTALAFAVEFKSHEAARVLIEHGASVLKASLMEPLLHRAVRVQSSGLVQLLLEYGGHCIAATIDDAGQTPLTLAVQITGKVGYRICKHLVEYSDVHSKTAAGNTPLMLASRADVIELLLQAGAKHLFSPPHLQQQEHVCHTAAS